MDYLGRISEIKKLFEDADDVGVKTVDNENDPKQSPVKIFSCRAGPFQPDPPVQSSAGQPDGPPCRPDRRNAVSRAKDPQG
ncbi:MAG: hypothetical protein P8Z73_00625 [Desulfobacteraceae bacterium]